MGTYDGSTIQLSVDGAQIGSGSVWPGSLEYLLPSSNDFYIGNYPGCADHEFVDAIDEVTPPTGRNPAPSIHGLKLSTNTVTVDSRGHVVFGASNGPSVSYTESRAANLTLRLLRSERGVRRRKSCVKPPAHARKLNCARFVVVSTATRSDRAGRVTVPLNQMLRYLTPGRYRLDLTPDANGKRGKTVSVRFVVRRSHR